MVKLGFKKTNPVIVLWAQLGQEQGPGPRAGRVCQGRRAEGGVGVWPDLIPGAGTRAAQDPQ